MKKVHPGKMFFGEKQVLEGHLLPSQIYQRTELRGYFQRIELFQENMSKAKKWLTPDSTDLSLSPKKSDLTLSIRRGTSGWPIKLCPSVDFYLGILEEIEFKKIYITTDSPLDNYFKPIFSTYPNTEFVNLNPLGQFEFIRKSYSIVVAPSTFSILASWSSEARNIYWPKIEALDFSNTEHNWFPSGEVRNHYIEGK
jgi:hypothetical protein